MAPALANFADMIDANAMRPANTMPALLSALMPAAFLALLVALLAWWISPRLQPAARAVSTVEASPTELADNWLQWTDPVKPEWRPVHLPVLSTCDVSCLAVYSAWRYRFDHSPELMPDPAVYFPHPDANIALYLNGSLIDMRGRMESPPSVFRYTPRLIRLPVGLLRAKANTLSWRLTLERQGVLQMHPFYLANYAELQPAYQGLNALSQDLILGGLWMQLAVWAVALGLRVRGNSDAVLSWYLWAAPGWMLIAAMQVFPSMLHSITARASLYIMAFYSVAAFTPLFVTALLEKPKTWLIRASAGYFILGLVLTLYCSLTLSAKNVISYNLTSYFQRYSILIIIPFIMWRLYHYLSKNRASQLARWVFAVASLTAIFGVHDVLQTRENADSLYLLTPLAGIGIAAALCLELGRRMRLSQLKLARYSEELESTVRAREVQLNAQFEKLRVADQERTLSEERGRIMRDMHDGVGGQLAVLVHMADDPKIGRDQIVEVVRTGLADMRLILDSLNHAGGDLLIALGTFRERITPLLSASKIRLHWQVDHTVQVDGLGPEVVLNLFRILQEAINNAVRHASAKTITMAIAQDVGAVLLSVSDDGIGFDPAQTMDGHYGLSGMQRRAEKIGVLLRVSAEANAGTVVSLRLGR